MRLRRFYLLQLSIPVRGSLFELPTQVVPFVEELPSHAKDFAGKLPIRDLFCIEPVAAMHSLPMDLAQVRGNGGDGIGRRSEPLQLRVLSIALCLIL